MIAMYRSTSYLSTTESVELLSFVGPLVLRRPKMRKSGQRSR